MSDYPPDWEDLPLGEVVEKITSGGTPKADNPDLYGGDIPFLKIDDITSSSKYLRSHKVTINERGLSESSAKIVPTGTLLLTMYGTIGRCCITTYPVATNQAIASFLGHPRVELEYLYYALESKADEFAVASSQTTQANISAGILKQTPIAIPPLPEQKKIAEILSGIDTMITKHNRKMVSLGHLQTSLIENITLGTKEAGSRQATDIGECPADWTATKLGDIADFANGNSFKSEDWGERGYPIIRIQNLNGGSEFNYFSGRIEEKWFVPHGSLLFAWSGQRGKSFGPFIWEGRDGVLNQHIFKVTHAKDIDRQYLFLLLKMVQLKAERDAHGFKDSFMHVKKSDIVSTSIAVPSLAVQKRLANLYTQLGLQISLEEKKMKFLKNIKNACSADLLSGRKRVSV